MVVIWTANVLLACATVSRLLALTLGLCAAQTVYGLATSAGNPSARTAAAARPRREARRKGAARATGRAGPGARRPRTAQRNGEPSKLGDRCGPSRQN